MANMEYVNVRQNSTLDVDNLGGGSVNCRSFVGGNHPNSLVTHEGMTIVVLKGNICDQMVDGLANSIGGEFNLSAGVISKAILQRAGSKIQDELTASKPKHPKYGEVYVTKGYGLNASWVFHGILKKWNQDRDDAKQVLRGFIKNVLTDAEERQLRKVAFPTVGCGALSFPADVVASCLFEECDKFSARNPNASVSEVRIVVYDKDAVTFSAFETKMSQLQTSQAVGSAPDDSDSDDDADSNAADSSEEDLDPSELIRALIEGLSGRVRKEKAVIRNSGIGCPTAWSPPDPADPYRKVPLQPSDQEYSAVAKKARASANGAINKIVKIERIENHNLWKLYMVTKENMAHANGSKVENERFLWHGTCLDSITNICAGGFNRAYCGKNAVFYGKGVYFARDFAYSAQATYSPKDSSGNKYIFQSRVLTGVFTVGTQDMIEPPPRDSSNIRVRFDSVTNDMSDPILWVVFKDTHAYPEYLVTFQ